MENEVMSDFEAGKKYARCLDVVVRKVWFAFRSSTWHPLYYEAIRDARTNFERAKELVLRYGDTRDIIKLRSLAKDLV